MAYLVRRVAAFRGVMALAKDDYALGYFDLIADDKKRRKSAARLEERLLTVNQIYIYCDQDWSRALASVIRCFPHDSWADRASVRRQSATAGRPDAPRFGLTGEIRCRGT